MKQLTKQIYRSSGFYPIAAFYIVSSLIAYLLARQWLGVEAGFLALFIGAVLASLVAALREVRMLRHRVDEQANLMDGQRTQTLKELDEMRAMLRAAGVTPPAAGEKEMEARRDEAEGKP